MGYDDQFINISISIPRTSFSRSPDENHNVSVVPDQYIPDNQYDLGHDDSVVPDCSFYDNVGKKDYETGFGRTKTPEITKQYNYKLSSSGELKRLKQESKIQLERNDPIKKKLSPWRLVIEEGQVITSSPIVKRPAYTEREDDGYEVFLRRAGWKGGLLAGYVEIEFYL